MRRERASRTLYIGTICGCCQRSLSSLWRYRLTMDSDVKRYWRCRASPLSHSLLNAHQPPSQLHKTLANMPHASSCR